MIEERIEPVALISVRQAASYLCLSVSMVYKLMDQGALPYVKLGRARRLRKEDLDAMIEKQLVGAAS